MGQREKSIQKKLKLGRVEEAKKAVFDLLNSNHTDYRFLFQIANDFALTLSEGGMSTTIKILQFIYSNSSGEEKSDAAFILGQYYHRSYQYELADKYFIDPAFQHSPKPLSYRIDSALAKGNLDLATNLIDVANEIWGNNPDSVQGKAKLFRLRKDYQAAKKCFFNYVDQAPDLTASHFLLGQYYYKFEGNKSMARIELRKALDLLKNDKYNNHYGYYLSTENIHDDLHGLYFEVLRELGDTAEVQNVFSSPEFRNVEFSWRIGQLWESGEYEKSVEILSELLSKTQNEIEKRYYSLMLGETHIQTKEYGKALVAYLQAIQIGELIWLPNIMEYVSAYICQRELQTCEKSNYFEKAISLNTNQAIKSLIQKLNNLGKYREVLEYCRQYSSMIDDESFTLAHLAKAYIRLKEYDKASDHLNALIELIPGHVWALEKKLSIYQQRGQYNEANEIFEKLSILTKEHTP